MRDPAVEDAVVNALKAVLSEINELKRVVEHVAAGPWGGGSAIVEQAICNGIEPLQARIGEINLARDRFHAEQQEELDEIAREKQELGRQQEQLKHRDKRLNSKAREQAVTEARLADRETSISLREKSLNEREQGLNERDKVLNERVKLMNEREKQSEVEKARVQDVMSRLERLSTSASRTIDKSMSSGTATSTDIVQRDSNTAVDTVINSKQRKRQFIDGPNLQNRGSKKARSITPVPSSVDFDRSTSFDTPRHRTVSMEQFSNSTVINKYLGFDLPSIEKVLDEEDSSQLLEDSTTGSQDEEQGIMRRPQAETTDMSTEFKRLPKYTYTKISSGSSIQQPSKPIHGYLASGLNISDNTVAPSVPLSPKLEEMFNQLILPQQWGSSNTEALRHRMKNDEQLAERKRTSWIFDAIAREPASKEFAACGYSCWTQKARRDPRVTIPDNGCNVCIGAGVDCISFIYVEGVVLRGKGRWNGKTFEPIDRDEQEVKAIDGKRWYLKWRHEQSSI